MNDFLDVTKYFEETFWPIRLQIPLKFRLNPHKHLTGFPEIIGTGSATALSLFVLRTQRKLSCQW
jgi:hypothetical protein